MPRQELQAVADATLSELLGTKARNGTKTYRGSVDQGVLQGHVASVQVLKIL